MFHADYERRIAQLERDNANLRELIADLKPRVESIESDLSAIMQEEPETYDEHGFRPVISDGAWTVGNNTFGVAPIYGAKEDGRANEHHEPIYNICVGHEVLYRGEWYEIVQRKAWDKPAEYSDYLVRRLRDGDETWLDGWKLQERVESWRWPISEAEQAICL